jgi:hypothetical protein
MCRRILPHINSASLTTIGSMLALAATATTLYYHPNSIITAQSHSRDFDRALWDENYVDARMRQFPGGSIVDSCLAPGVDADVKLEEFLQSLAGSEEELQARDGDTADAEYDRGRE